MNISRIETRGAKSLEQFLYADILTLMDWRRSAAGKIAAVFAASVITVCLVMAAAPPKAGESPAERPAILLEGDDYRVPAQVGEPAASAKTDDSRPSFLQKDFSKAISVLNVFDAGNISSFFGLKAGSKDGPADDRDTILLKLRI